MIKFKCAYLVLAERIIIMAKKKANDKLNKHLTLSDRVAIFEELAKGTNLRTIGELIGKDPTTISKEIRLHRYMKERTTYFVGTGSGRKCSNFKTCSKRNVCPQNCSTQECRYCSKIKCIERCNDFKPKVCKQTSRFPYTCHSCPKKSSCPLDHYYYDPKRAQSSYEEILSNSRTGIDLDDNGFKQIDKIVSDGVKKGLSPYAIKQIHPEINVSERTLYRYIENKYLSTINLDLRRKVKYKKRYRSKSNSKAVIECRKNRLYSDFIEYLTNHPGTLIWQMDLVEGLKGDNQYFLTLHLPIANFMIAHLIPSKSPLYIIEYFNYLENVLGTKMFKAIFQVILTDRGGEFTNPDGIETSQLTNEKRTKLFYCDSYTSSQKSEIENNHRLIRYYCPKGKSINFLTDEKVKLMLSHINSYPREVKNNSTPYEIVKAILGETFLNKIGVTRIDGSNLNLTPKLIK